jgi:Leucine-rich repeat (LRR) protein
MSIGAEEAERRVAQALEEGSAKLSLADLAIECLPPGVGKLTGLTFFDLNGCRELRDIRFVDGLGNLHSIELSRCAQMQDLTPLAALTNLQSLNLGGCKQLQDLTPLAGLVNLQSLNLGLCGPTAESRSGTSSTELPRYCRG